jgi:CubicO group peptidase (beta-lactamase class C family)
MLAAMKRVFALVAGAACAAAFLVAPAGASAASQRARIDAVIKQAIREQGIRSLLVDVQVGNRRVIRKAYGESESGVPASTRMHFRNGNVAAMYMSTLLLRLVDQKKVKLSDKLSKWIRFPYADQVTLEMLAGMKTGYPDYVRNQNLAQFIYADPFYRVTTKDQLQLSLAKPHQFAPGTNWSYSHTNYVLLGLALEKITKTSLRTALARYVLRPLKLRNTRGSQTSRIPEPVLHTYSSERRGYLQIPAGQRFYEETTFWNPSWTFASGSIETTNIADMASSVRAIGAGRLLSRASYRKQIDPQIGFGHHVPNPECDSCRGPLSFALGYGLGVFRNGNWLGAQPLFAGLGSVAGYRPKGRVSIVIVAAAGERGFDSDGAINNASRPLYRQIGLIVAPKDPPPAGS